MAAIEDQLTSVSIRGFAGDFVMTKIDHEQCVRFKPPKTHSLSLLPYEDPYTKGYKVRNRLIDKEHEKDAYPGGEVRPTTLLDGRIIGTWNRALGEEKGPIKLKFFSRPSREVEREAIRKAKAASRLMMGSEINVEVEVESQ